ncbi:methylenetetrahydrofolate reductase [Actinophytocola sediminis]
MRNDELAALLRQPRYEVIPTKSVEDRILAIVPHEVTITVTASPAKGLEPTFALAEQLAAHGYRAVPHVSARLVRDEIHLKELVDRLVCAGIEDIFVPAGDSASPAGKYDGALALLRDLAALGRPFANVGITGYPESHPRINDDIVVQAMWDKRAHATYIVSNLCFAPKVLNAWVDRVRRRGVTLPILLGLAGPVERAKLLSMATKIGVGESTRFLLRHGSWFLRMATPGAYSPERLLTRTPPDTTIAGLHVYTFNQVAETEQWRGNLLSAR